MINDDDMDTMNARAYRRARMAESSETRIPTALGVWCMIHAQYNCPQPNCWRCGNHLVSNDRCVDPSCRATVTAEVVTLVRELGVDSPIELLTYEVGRMLSRAGRRGTGPGDGVLSSPAPTPSDVEA